MLQFRHRNAATFMKFRIPIICLMLLLCTMVSCTTYKTYKETRFPDSPMVYSLALKLMDVNWIDQELAHIPLMIEETRQGNLITKVRVEPTGDIRLPGGGADDVAFRWHVESCTATRVDAPYTLSLRLTYIVYPGEITQIIDDGTTKTTLWYTSNGRESYARVLVYRAADGTFTMELKNDIISEECDIEPHHFIRNPSFWQQSLELQLVPEIE